MEPTTPSLESYGRAYQELVDALKRFPQEMWRFKPLPDGWSIQEILLHLADNETNAYMRCRKFVAEPGTSVMTYDESAWARELHYQDQDAGEALELFKRLRLQSYKLIKSLPESVWSNTIQHPEQGTITMTEWFARHGRHVTNHIQQMQANYEAWLRQK